jgi:hypothetical protein
MFARKLVYAILPAVLCIAAAPASSQQVRKEYLSGSEADKIRDAETPQERIHLFVTFATDRLTKLKYELAHPTADRRRAERLNSLINAYSGCLDDSADLMLIAIEKQQDVHLAVKEFQTKVKEFIEYLQQLAKNGPELDSYRNNLDDAIEATQDALKDADKAAKDIAPPPVRRKQ